MTVANVFYLARKKPNKKDGYHAKDQIGNNRIQLKIVGHEEKRQNDKRHAKNCSNGVLRYQPQFLTETKIGSRIKWVDRATYALFCHRQNANAPQIAKCTANLLLLKSLAQ